MKRQPTTQQITWFLDLDRNKQLNLEPPYQRKSVWSSKDRKFFLDTIFRNYPAPPIFIHRVVDDNGFATYHVVDGKQRLQTILSFFNNKISIASDFGDDNLNGKKFKQLSTEHKRNFWDYTIVVDFIDTIEGKNIEEVFDRVNRNARNLQPQELRHARYNGWFINQVEEEAQLDFWWNFKISTRGRDKRMRNVQFIAELYANVIDNKIVGFSHDYIDSIFAKYDDIEDFNEGQTFEPQEIIDKVNEIKLTINDMDAVNDCIETFAAGSNNNFYTLWAVLNELMPENPDEIAQKYLDFMESVNGINDDNIEGGDFGEDEIKYFENSRGASTDLTQRKNRYDVLLQVLS